MPLQLRLTGQHKDLGGGFIVRRLLPETMGRVPREVELIPLPE